MSEVLDYDKKYFTTSELPLCASLICLNFSLDSLDKTNPQRTIFIFKQSKELSKAVNDFWQRKIRLEPLEYFEATRYLKSRIYGG